MIGFLKGEILFSDGTELVMLTASGIGYNIYYNRVLAEGTPAGIYISQVTRENSVELFGFFSLREKKIFETLISVKGVGPKSAYSLMGVLGGEQLIEAIAMENKKVLTKAPGVGPKAAAQIILDLGSKISKMRMYGFVHAENHSELRILNEDSKAAMDFDSCDDLMDDTLMARKELGFKEENILPIAKRILAENKINKSEQLVHLVLKEI